MRIVFFGSGEFALPTFDFFGHEGHEIRLVVSQPDKPGGRGKELTPTPVARAARAAGLPLLTPQNVNDPASVERIRGVGADLAYVAAFGQKIGPPLLAAFPVGIINLHASLLPAWRGAAPIQHAVMNGDAETGVSFFRLVDKMDAGPILVQRRTAIGIDETADELHDRLARIGCDALRATLELLAADPKSPGTPQDESRVTLAPKLRKSDGRITFDLPARTLGHRICGLWSWPGAACRFVAADGRRDEHVILVRARPCEGPPHPPRDTCEHGCITELLTVQAADHELEILEIKPAGGARMTWRDYVNGRHVRPGDRLIPLEIG
jgi:methionyl-tRNA formyltransferase